MNNRTGLCKYCKHWTPWCTQSRACDGNSGFVPFAPVDGLKYSREEIIEKWLNQKQGGGHERKGYQRGFGNRYRQGFFGKRIRRLWRFCVVDLVIFFEKKEV